MKRCSKIRTPFYRRISTILLAVLIMGSILSISLGCNKSNGEGKSLAWAVGAEGGIYFSDNDGNSWKRQDSGTKWSLRAVASYDESVVWAVGDWGLVLRTNNGGKDWERVDFPLEENLYDICIVDKGMIWVAGLNHIVKSEDGGDSWSIQIESSNLITEIFALNKRTAWAVKHDNEVLHTNDGGISWEALTVDADVELHCVYALSADDIWVAGYDGAIFNSVDGGVTWSDFSMDSEKHLFSINMFDEKSGVVVGQGIYKTIDGGTTWSKKEIGTINDLLDISFYSEMEGYAVGTSGTVLTTIDGGDSWVRQEWVCRESLVGVTSISKPDIE